MKTGQLQCEPMQNRTTANDGNHQPGTFSPSDPEVPEKKPKRRFTAAYKLHILQEYESCRQPGEIGALLWREGLYHSNISTWRKQHG
ncbi:MAG: hypothetical protein JRF57_06285 [Deltaproteobacteria bacterium]|nr:hypothetical protein [Deltaproteobacteria bacterium]